MILAVSQYVARQCEGHYGVTPPRVRVVFNGVQAAPASAETRAADRVALRRQYDIPDDALVLLFIAHNLRLKGMEPLVEAVGRLVRAGLENLVVLVVGRDNPVRFSKQIDQQRLRRHIIFTGPTQRVGAFFHTADVCVHPTYYDPCSRVVLEALWHGVPCITTAYNGAAEIITDRQDGCVIADPDDVTAMTSRIESLRSADARRRMSDAALRLRDRISMTRHVAELDAVFRELAARRRAPMSA